MKLKLLVALTIPLILYQGLVSGLDIENYFPSLKELGSSISENISNGRLLYDSFQSVKRVIVGYSIAAVFGVLLGLILGYNLQFKFMKIYIDLLKPIPPIAWIPIAIIMFGLGDPAAYFIVFLGAFFPIFTSTYFGAESFPSIYRNVSSSFEISGIQFFRKILFAYCLPYIFTGLKIGLGMAWMSVIAAELIGAQSGLGYSIQLNRLLLQTQNIILNMLCIGIIGFGLQKIIEYIEKISMPWRVGK